jgi:phosphoserine phosphatase RsbU/P
MTSPLEHGKYNAQVPHESLEELYECAPCGYLSVTAEGLIVKVNSTFACWLGYTQDELTLGMRFPDLLSVGGKIFYETHLARMMQFRGEIKEIALDFKAKDGRIIPSLLSATPKRETMGMPVINRIVVFNTTQRREYERELLAERRRAEEMAAQLARTNAELERSNAALLEANEGLGEFAFAVSHDLQEPLRTMTVYADMLVRRYQHQLDGEGPFLIKQIVEGSRRMQALITDLLSFSQAKGTRLATKLMDINLPLQLAISNLGSAINESNATVTQDELPFLTVDGARITQLFQNLLGNAIKYRRPGVPPQIHLSCVRSGLEYVFSIRDNGMGFESKYAEQIFGMLKRLHGRDIPGTGIGLAICRKIVESHGGRVWAEGTPGVGSIFSFTIPVSPSR